MGPSVLRDYASGTRALQAAVRPPAGREAASTWCVRPHGAGMPKGPASSVLPLATSADRWTLPGGARAPGAGRPACQRPRPSGTDTGGAKGVVFYCGGVTNGSASTAEVVAHELGDVVDGKPQ